MEPAFSVRRIFFHSFSMFFLTASIGIAQGISKKYLLPRFSYASSIIPLNERFQFENFRQGFVNKRTGGQSEAKLNYSYLYGDILFIGPSADTLSIMDANLVKTVSIGDNIYTYDPKYGFVEITAEYDGVKVGRKSQLVLIDYDTRGSYSKLGSPVSRPYENSFVKMPGGNADINSLANLQLSPRSLYFFIDRNGRSHIAERASLLKIYARSKRKVVAYLNTRDVDYENENDLRKVIEDCGKLAELP